MATFSDNFFEGGGSLDGRVLLDQINFGERCNRKVPLCRQNIFGPLLLKRCAPSDIVWGVAESEQIRFNGTIVLGR